MEQQIQNFENTMIYDNREDKFFFVKRQILKDAFHGDKKSLQEFQKMIHTDRVKQVNNHYLFVNDIDNIEFEESFDTIEEEIEE